jgi:MFS family permease
MYGWMRVSTTLTAAAATSDRIGRKPLLTGGMALISMGMLGISMCSSFEELLVCRLITGLGVSGFTTGATLYLTDISTPFNRTKSMVGYKSSSR